MIELKVYNTAGSQVDTVQIDEALLGGSVRRALLRQALVMYEANRRVGLARTKTRGEVAGSGRKLYRQKGTGNARMGMRRQPVRVGGGTAHGPKPKSWRQALPVKARRRALMSACLAKMLDGEVVVLDALDLSVAKTKTVAAMLKNLGVTGRVMVVTDGYEPLTVRCTRNIEGAKVSEVRCLNAWDVIVPKKVIFTRPAIERFVGQLKEWQEKGAPGAAREAAAV